ncbi:hypothetical protein Y1Q_0017878 [Alligator mississippiensis]|uniref:Uncharacterized protein n=1 Tax=Alligator mississippiensis TaxID=8496 RepID=A0A151PHB9_ALLMI|nr:hypothetical protein Y1Q_0017878 [Alligator mississippiensis]
MGVQNWKRARQCNRRQRCQKNRKEKRMGKQRGRDKRETSNRSREPRKPRALGSAVSRTPRPGRAPRSDRQLTSWASSLSVKANPDPCCPPVVRSEHCSPEQRRGGGKTNPLFRAALLWSRRDLRSV